jgi:hypothetical protein
MKDPYLKDRNAVWCDRTMIQLPFNLCLCVTRKQYARELKKMGVTNGNPFVSPGAGATLHRFDPKTDSDDPIAIVCLDEEHRKNLELNQTHALLVHEAMHLWRYSRKYLGESKPSKEFEAYAIQAISQRLFYAYDELTNREKK